VYRIKEVSRALFCSFRGVERRTPPSAASHYLDAGVDKTTYHWKQRGARVPVPHIGVASYGAPGHVPPSTSNV